MTEITAGEAPTRKRGKALLLGLVGTIAMGAGGFFASYGGLIAAPGLPASQATPLPAIEFVAMEPIMISLGPQASARHLRFAAQIEVAAPHVAEVRLLLPRIADVLNGYLRAVEVRQLQDPAALVRLRAQMLRRIQIVTGEGRVRDLLISEFVLN